MPTGSPLASQPSKRVGPRSSAQQSMEASSLFARPFGRESTVFLAVSDVGGALPPLAAVAMGLLAWRRSTGTPRRGWLLLALGWLAWAAVARQTIALYEDLLGRGSGS